MLLQVLRRAPALALVLAAAAAIATPDARSAAAPETSIYNYDFWYGNADVWFRSDVPDATFECRLDGAAFKGCVSPHQYRGLAVGAHTFEVRAVSGGVVDDSPANITFTATEEPRPQPVGPANDSWWAPQEITGSTGSVEGTTAGATTQWDEPFTPYEETATVWYLYTATRTGDVTFTVPATSFSARISNCSGQNAEWCYHHASGVGSLTLRTWQGLQYRISVDTADGRTGPFTLSWSYGPTGPPNDYRAEAQTIDGLSGEVTGTNVAATVESNEPRHDGGAGLNEGHSVWYRWTAPASGTAFFATTGSSFDTHLRAYVESWDGSLVGDGFYWEDVNPWTKSSRVELRAQAGRTYLFAVDGEGGATGDIRLSWRTAVPTGRDGTLPTVQMLSPQPGSTVTGTIRFSADAADDVAVDRVAYSIHPNGEPGPSWFVGEAFAPPYEVELDTRVLAPGVYSVNATAWDADGNGASYGFTITVSAGVPAPTLSLPSAVTAEATRPDGAFVRFVATARDYKGTTLTPTCNPRAGSLFPLGKTTVTCSARDAFGGSARGSFVVTVVDTTAPVLTVPETVVVDATSAKGAAVEYTVLVADRVTRELQAKCTRPSGDTFAVGDTIVECSATDAAGNTGTGAFTVHVKGADEQLADLSALVASWGIDAHLADRLTAQLADVRKHLAAKQGNAACGGLVEVADAAVKEDGKRLTTEQSARVAADAKRIGSVAGC